MIRLLLVTMTTFASVLALAQSSAENAAPNASATQLEGVQTVTPIEEPKNFKTEDFEELQLANWGASVFSLGVLEQDALDKSKSANLFTYNYVSLNYKMSKKSRISFRPAFSWDTGGVDPRENKVSPMMKAQDFHVAWSRYDWTNDIVKTDTALKLYLPTSSSSIDTGMIAMIKPEVRFTLDILDYSAIKYSVKPEFYIQRNTSYVTASGFANATKRLEIEHVMDLELDISKHFMSVSRIGFIDTFRNAATVENFGKTTSLAEGHETEAYAGTGIKWIPNYKFNISAVYTNSAKLVDSSRIVSYSFGRPEDNEIVFLTNISLF